MKEYRLLSEDDKAKIKDMARFITSGLYEDFAPEFDCDDEESYDRYYKEVLSYFKDEFPRRTKAPAPVVK